MNTKNCVCCGKPTTNPKFCSRSCSATITSKNKPPRSTESKQKTAKSLKLTLNGKRNPNSGRRPTTKIELINCVGCGKKTYVRKGRKTCSDICRNTVRSKNGIRTNRVLYKNVWLDSSWELQIAILLDSLNITWIRPEPLQYEDQGKTRKYYPDFYLPKFNLYIDPKNPYRMLRDQTKLNYFTHLNLLVGDVNYIMARLAGLEPACVQI